MRKYEISAVLSTRILDQDGVSLEYRILEEVSHGRHAVKVIVNDKEAGSMTYSIKNIESIYIHRMKNATLHTARELSHIGTLLFEYAFKMSIAKGLRGRVKLYAASGSTCPACYFKMGFRTEDAARNVQFLTLLETKVLLTKEDCHNMSGEMYLPEVAIKEKRTEFGLTEPGLSLLEFLFENRPDPDARLKHQFSLLRTACLHNDKESVLRLIVSGVDVNYVHGEWTHLDFCCTIGHWMLAKQLIELGSNINADSKKELQRIQFSKKERGASEELNEFIKCILVKYLNIFIKKIKQEIHCVNFQGTSPGMFGLDNLRKQLKYAEHLKAIIDGGPSRNALDISQCTECCDELKTLFDYAYQFGIIHANEATLLNLG